MCDGCDERRDVSGSEMELRQQLVVNNLVLKVNIHNQQRGGRERQRRTTYISFSNQGKGRHTAGASTYGNNLRSFLLA